MFMIISLKRKCALRHTALIAAATTLITACDISDPKSFLDWGVNTPVVTFEVDGITYRAADRKGIPPEKLGESGDRFRVPMGSQGQINIYCKTLADCEAKVRKSAEHQEKIAYRQPTVRSKPPSGYTPDEETSFGD
jgi:hypothetical protein